jgi:hypothetical protein
MTGPRPPAPENPRSRPGHSPAIAQSNAAAARASAQPPTAPPAVPGVIPHDKMSYEQKRFAQDQAARRGGR